MDNPAFWTVPQALVVVMANTCPLQQAVRWNYEAVLFVHSGRLVEAICALETATDMLWTSTFSARRSEGSCFAISTELNDALDDRAARCVGVTYNQEGQMYIYDRLLLPPRDLWCTSTPSHCTAMLHTMSVLTLFNLALSHHLHGRTTMTMVSFTKAKALYGRILEECKSGPKDALLKCLVLNNLADVHQHFGGFDRSRVCLNRHAEIAAQTQCLQNTLVLAPYEMRAILLNHILAQFPAPAQAA
jgi:hypothetical protein